MNDQIKILGPEGLKRIYSNIQANISNFQDNTLNNIKEVNEQVN